MAMQLAKNDGKELSNESVETSVTSSPINSNINAPKYGTVVPNRVFVGGIATSTTEQELSQLFSTYGNVISTKIIFDRAGVSKGYGFVTFKTDEEAKRLQKDADNIVLKERRLNIAPAIMKQQMYGGRLYETMHPAAGPGANQLFRHNGVTFTYHNGMAFFPQQTPGPQTAQPPAPTNVEPAPIYPTGAYGGMPPNNNGQTYPFSSYPPQNMFYQPPHYPYSVSQFDGCYSMTDQHGGVMVPPGTEQNSMVLPAPFYMSPQAPLPEVAYFSPQGPIPSNQQLSTLPQDSIQPMVYQSPRGYDTNTVFYPEQLPVHDCPSTPSAEEEQSKPEEDKTTIITNPPQQRTETPVVSALNVFNKSNNGAPKYRSKSNTTSGATNSNGNGELFLPSRTFYQGRKHAHQNHPRHLNNNNPDISNQNMGKKGRRPSGPPHHYPTQCPYPNLHNSSMINKPFNVSIRHQSLPHTPQVPQFPFFSGPRPFFNPVHQVSPSVYQASSRRSVNHQRPRFNGRGGKSGGGGKSNSSWYKENGGGDSGPEEGSVLVSTLTPPITPRSSQGLNLAMSPTEQVQASIQALSI